YYTLRVDPRKPGPRPATVVFEVRSPGFGELGITSHHDNDNIHDQLDGLIAFGTLGDESIKSVTMTPTRGGHPIAANKPITEDWDHDTWTATFPALGILGNPDTYTLAVTDFANNQLQRTGLNPRSP